ncbi:MAG TPA: DUF58 domain-containing protein [Capsulimonadaceae bacterium]|nr:DUF58 domain-containing protein [Capsulimonadaceae bacterium]
MFILQKIRRRQGEKGARRAAAWPSFASTKDIEYHPYLRGSISRWLWRFYMYRLTRSGRWFLWLTAAFAVYGSTSLQLQVYVPFTYAFGLWFVALIAALAGAPRVRLTARHADRVSAGDTLPVDIEVSRRGRFPAAELFVLPHRLPPAIDAAEPQGVPAPPLSPGQSARVRLGLICKRRGVYDLKGYRVQTDLPYGLLRAYRVFAESQTLLVYPRFTRLARLEIPTGRRYQPGGVALASSLGDSYEFIGNREFREGDSLRNIDWRATARLSRLIVREYREEYFHRVAVILDTHVPRRDRYAQREALEQAISLCAAVSDYMAREEYIVDLFAAGPNLYHLTAGRSLAYLDQILDILACIEENPNEPFQTIEPELLEDLEQITTVICVLLDWNETRRAFVHQLRSEGAGIKVIIVRDTPCTIDPVVDSDLLGHIPVVSSQDFARGMEEL